MRRHLSNAVYGVLDYASYPLGILLLRPAIEKMRSDFSMPIPIACELKEDWKL
jgi:hypothetical protein